MEAPLPERVRDRQLGNSRQEVQAHAELGRGPWPARGEPIVVPVEINQWAGASVLGIIASTALLIVDTIYIKLPYAAAAVFLALLMPGLLLSLHVLLQDVDLGKEDLMRAAGDTDESCGFTSVLRSWVKAMAASAALLVIVALFSTAWLAAVASRDRGAVVVWAVAPLFAAAILLGVLFFFAHRAGRRAVNDLEFKLEHPPTAAVQVVAPPPAADVELVAP